MRTWAHRPLVRDLTASDYDCGRSDQVRVAAIRALKETTGERRTCVQRVRYAVYCREA